MNRLILSLTLLSSLLFPSVEGDAAKVFGPMVKKPSGASYAFLLSKADNPSGSGNVDTFTANIGACSGCVIAIFVGYPNAYNVATAITVGAASLSVVSSSQQPNTSGQYSAWWSGTVNLTGSQTVSVTFTSSIQFQFIGYQIYSLSNLSSTTAQNGNFGFGGLSIGVTAGYFLLAANTNNPVTAVPPWASPTETPFSTHVDSGPYSSAEDWTIINTNASFSTGNIGTWSAVTFH